MSASPPLRQPCPPGACVCERERLEAPGADRRIPPDPPGRAAPGRSPEALRSLEDLEHLLRRMEEQPGIRLRIAPAFGEVRSMRGIRMRFEEQPGLCRKTRQAIPAAIRRGLRSARKSPTPCSTPTTSAARRLKALNDRKRMSLKTWAGFRVSADNAHGVIRPTGRSGCRRAPGPPESLAGLATAPGFSSPTPPARRRTSPAGGAGRHRTGCAVRRGGCRRGFPCRAADRRGAGPAPARWHGRPGRWRQRWKRAALGWYAGSRRCPDIALAELAFELGEEVLHVRNEAPQHLDDQPRLPPKRPTISPRASTSSPASAAVAGAPLAPLLPR